MFPLDSDKVGAFWLDLVGNWGFWGEFLMEGGGMGRWRRCLIEGDAVFEAAAGELRVVAADGVLIRRSGFYMLSWSRPRLVAQDPAVGNGCWGEDWSWVGSQVPLPPEVQALRDWIRESNLYLQSLPSWIFHFFVFLVSRCWFEYAGFVSGQKMRIWKSSMIGKRVLLFWLII